MSASSRTPPKQRDHLGGWSRCVPPGTVSPQGKLAYRVGAAPGASPPAKFINAGRLVASRRCRCPCSREDHAHVVDLVVFLVAVAIIVALVGRGRGPANLVRGFRFGVREFRRARV